MKIYPILHQREKRFIIMPAKAKELSFSDEKIYEMLLEKLVRFEHEEAHEGTETYGNHLKAGGTKTR
jgi:hypothetical protein